MGHYVIRSFIVCSAIVATLACSITQTGDAVMYTPTEETITANQVQWTQDHVSINTDESEIKAQLAGNDIDDQLIVNQIKEQPSKDEQKEQLIESDANDNNNASQQEETKKQEKSSKVNAPYVGTFSIPGLGLNVKCYSSWEQSVVDAKNSAAYFIGYGHEVIADHKNQGFDKIKKCSVGTTAVFETNGKQLEYVCVDKINGHNTGKDLTDNNYKSIDEYYPGALVCYTCNENWKNITIVFFELKKDCDDVHINGQQDADSTTICNIVGHKWSDWKIAWESINDNGKYYGWNERSCNICDEDEWVMRSEPSEQYLKEYELNSQSQDKE